MSLNRAMRIGIFLLLLAILPHKTMAQDATPLPPPMIISTTIPPVIIPSEVVRELQNGAIVCQQRSQDFNFKVGTMVIADFNSDKRADYISSSAGYLCNESHTLFEDPQGDSYHIFLSRSGGNGLAKHEEIIHAYALSIDNTTTPPQMVFTVACPNHPDPLSRGQTRLQWDRDKLRTITRQIGCHTAAAIKESRAALLPPPPVKASESADQISKPTASPAAAIPAKPDTAAPAPEKQNQQIEEELKAALSTAPVPTPAPASAPAPAAPEPAAPLGAEDLLNAPEKPLAPRPH